MSVWHRSADGRRRYDVRYPSVCQVALHDSRDCSSTLPECVDLLHSRIRLVSQRVLNNAPPFPGRAMKAAVRAAMNGFMDALMLWTSRRCPVFCGESPACSSGAGRSRRRREAMTRIFRNFVAGRSPRPAASTSSRRHGGSGFRDLGVSRSMSGEITRCKRRRTFVFVRSGNRWLSGTRTHRISSALSITTLGLCYFSRHEIDRSLSSFHRSQTLGSRPLPRRSEADRPPRRARSSTAPRTPSSATGCGRARQPPSSLPRETSRSPRMRR